MKLLWVPIKLNISPLVNSFYIRDSRLKRKIKTIKFLRNRSVYLKQKSIVVVDAREICRDLKIIV